MDATILAGTSWAGPVFARREGSIAPVRAIRSERRVAALAKTIPMH
jgi:hypothetical protein